MIKRTLGYMATVCVAAGLASATALAQRGVGRTGPNALEAADKIGLKVLRAKGGSPLGFLKTVIMPHGRDVRISAGNANN
jgi:hypothetical protein